MKTNLVLSLAAALLSGAAFVGCTREDIREMTVVMPGLKAAEQPLVLEAIAKYNGIDKNSYKWDLAAGTLTLRYDSMQVAQSNIRYAIEERGIKVEFPKKTDNHAGY